ncbi:MAG: hypothetical protein QM682_12210 [Paracoccus sp. (in: a-proteobacteria)]|uniref:hypothetical protein n=1 Tax=Paracoccus sp. TaxID=267 RepID=UPI0039E611CA
MSIPAITPLAASAVIPPRGEAAQDPAQRDVSRPVSGPSAGGEAGTAQLADAWPQGRHKTRRDDPGADGQGRDGFRMSDEMVERLAESDPALARLLREATQPETTDVSPAPMDQIAFRAKVIAYLKSVYGDDPGFQRALKLGTITVRAVPGDEEAELQDSATHQLYRSTAREATAAAGNPLRPGRGDFIAWWPK